MYCKYGIKVVLLNHGSNQAILKTNEMETIIKTKAQLKRENAIKANELLKTCPKEQAKFAKQLRKLGLL